MAARSNNKNSAKNSVKRLAVRKSEETLLNVAGKSFIVKFPVNKNADYDERKIEILGINLVKYTHYYYYEDGEIKEMSHSYKLKQKFEFYERALLDQCGVNVRELLSNKVSSQERIAHRSAFKSVLEELQKVVHERERKQRVDNIHKELFPLLARRYELGGLINWDEVEIIRKRNHYYDDPEYYDPIVNECFDYNGKIIRMINHGDSRQERRLKKFQVVDKRIEELTDLVKSLENTKEWTERRKWERSFNDF